MKLALAGYGKMGHEIEAVAKARGHEIVAIFDIDKMLSPEALKLHAPDAVIDFTQPDTVVTNVRVCTKAKIPMVIGTTGWDNDVPKVKKMVDEAGIGCIVASNFSIGVNLFLKIVQSASRLLSVADYDVFITEAHHRTKKDFIGLRSILRRYWGDKKGCHCEELFFSEGKENDEAIPSRIICTLKFLPLLEGIASSG